MRTSEAVLLGVGGLVVFELLRKSTALGTLNFYPTGIRKFEFDGITPVLTVGLAAQNTSNKDFSFNSIAGNVFADNYFVGNISAFGEPVQIRHNAQTVIDIKIRLGLIGITNNIIQAIQTGNVSVNLEINSNANVDGIQIPIDMKFKLGL